MKMKSILLGLVFLLYAGLIQAQPKVNLKILDVAKQGGKIYVSLFNSEQSYNKRQVFRSFTIDPQSDSTKITFELPAGEYLFSAYQDSNNNGKLDCSMFGIPKERFGFSNYNGKSIPGDFHKLKVQITKEATELMLRLVKI